jgi:hypothetical protein
MFRRSRKADSHKERRQARVLFLSLSSFVVLGIPLDLLFARYHALNIPAIGLLVIAIIYIPSLWYGITRYRLIHFMPSLMADEIIAHIQETVLLLGPDLRVLSANTRAGGLLGIAYERLQGIAIHDLLADPEFLMDELHEPGRGEGGGRSTRITFRGAKERVVAESYLSGVTDRFGDPVGVLVSARENCRRGILRSISASRPARSRWRTRSSTGRPYASSPGAPAISERTVDTHITNNYNRLGVSNRIELARLAANTG